MGTLTAEKLAQRAIDVDVVTESDLRNVWSEFGTRNVELEPFKQSLLRSGLLTNYQLDRLCEGLRTGFYYGDYKVLYGVGAGTFARVFRATHKVTGEQFAIKVLRKRYSSIPDEAEQFRREGELGMQLKHPNIVAIHEVFSKGSVHYLVMDFVEGRNLRDFYKVRGKFEPLEATRILIDMVTGLHYSFQQGVSHRDLKMSNVILSSDGQAKLLDFGLAGQGGMDAEDSNPRTIDYAGLERSTNVRKDDARSDIFFVGSIYYQLLSGVAALSETRERAQRLSKSRFKDIKAIGIVAPDVPIALARVVSKALEFEPSRRYQTPGEMLADLKLAHKRVEDGVGSSPANQQEGKKLEGHDDQGECRKLMIVESDVKMQNLFRKLFKTCGYRVLVTSSPDRVFESLYNDASSIDLLLICTGEIGRESLDAFNRIGHETATKSLPAVLLLGDQHADWAGEVEIAPHRILLQMPVKSKELRVALLKAARAVAPAK
ncbi:serine/threonine protein kinase [Adhaeretor mobilis]|uniref:non-specific serine/threonine protein kinase n=1 Tax=Adhaeretor mobilis TaxID=1930276 RepID=A0A517MU18_9BACT|nr:serine/threonine-protein kinase [Adhaeretor mobilis]QDS98376.1 Serine/threonine-protein kinase PrkC [Adhaeretor mobilis]